MESERINSWGDRRFGERWSRPGRVTAGDAPGLVRGNREEVQRPIRPSDVGTET